MNKRDKIMSEKAIYNAYHIPGMSNLHRVKKNAIMISTANSYEHELEKFNICYKLKGQYHNFITEAEKSINGVKYRRDVVDITTGEVYEVETDPKRAERFISDPDKDIITVVKLWRVKDGRSSKGVSK